MSKYDMSNVIKGNLEHNFLNGLTFSRIITAERLTMCTLSVKYLIRKSKGD